MDGISTAQIAIWGIAAVATGGVIIRPWRWPEAIWAVIGAAALVLLALLPWHDALAAIAKGTDVYLFLTGMMLLAELARREGSQGQAATLSSHLRLYRQCRELRPADFKPGQSRALRQPHAVAAALVEAIRVAVRLVYSRNVYCAEMALPERSTG